MKVIKKIKNWPTRMSHDEIPSINFSAKEKTQFLYKFQYICFMGVI